MDKFIKMLDYIKGDNILEKIAVIELKTTSVKMQIVDIVRNKLFEPTKTLEMPINLTKDFYGDLFIKSNVIKEITNILLVFKKIIESYECTDTICLASDMLKEAKNVNGFIDELSVITGFKFRVLDFEESALALYTSVINTFNRPKAVIFNILDNSTEVVLYNRRNILNKVIIPYGCVSVYDKMSDKTIDEKYDEIFKSVKKELEESNLKNDLPEEFDLIGAGDMFKYYGAVCRKAKKYPIEIAHNFTSSKQDMEKVYNLMKGLDVSSATKIKGIPLHDSKYFPSAMIIIKALIDNFEKDEFSISKFGRADGMLFHNVIPLTIEKPISDTLGFSLQSINEYYDRKPNNSTHIYELCMILFKQLRVLHKLPRPYVKVLRIAGYLSNGGYRVDVENSDRSVFDVIKNSTIMGVSHTDIIMGAFVCLCKNSDNFNLAEWVKYKEYLTEEDLSAVKKLAVILKIAEALDVTGFGLITDISCDILGDSVIMKTITTDNANFEINYTSLCNADFKKIFAKNLEVL